MRKWMISLLSVMALSLTFSGCGESGSATSTSNGLSDSGSVEELVIDNGDTTDTTITNEFGLNPSLGTPPPLPAS